MSTFSLPTSAEIQGAAVSDQGKLRDLVLKSLEYGTQDCEALEERNEQLCALLSDAWGSCVDMEDTLVDILWLKSSMLASIDTSPSKTAFIEVLKELVKISDRESFWIKLQRSLQPSLIEACGLGPEQELLKKLKMHNTQVHYKQQKYNLLQEEAEGYSKALHFFLSQDIMDEQRRSTLLQLIGTFELDPNRLLDLTLDILEAKLYPKDSMSVKKPQVTTQVTWLFDVMKEFSLSKLHPLIRFRLSLEKEPSKKFLSTVAFLALNSVLDLQTLVEEFLDPIEDPIEEAHQILLMKEKKRIQGLSRISLSGTTKENPEIAKLKDRLDKALESLENDVFLRLALILLEWGEWKLIKPLLPVNVWSHLCTLLPEKFGSAFCDVAQNILLPWYTAKSCMPNLSKARAMNSETVLAEDSHTELTVDLAVRALSDPLLCIARSACISSRPVLYCQLCRLFQYLLDDGEAEHHISDETYDFFQSFLVPSLSLFPSNPALCTELWGVLTRLPYATRYRLYDDWRGSGLESAGLSSLSNGKPLPNIESEIRAGKATRYVLKRLSKDNIRDMSRQIAQVTHSNPLVVFTTILQQIESYDNMVEVMVDAQRYVSPLGLDILGYCILTRLSGTKGGVNRSRLKEDGVNVSQWLQSLETFTGAFFKRCPFVELRGILCYLMRRLRDGNVMELGILRTLLKVPGGYSFADYSPAASLSNSQLVGRSGSILLKRETMSFGIADEISDRAAERIRHNLQTDGFGVSMLILISQVRSRILFESSSGVPKEVKLVGNLYDSCQVVMTILLEFLTGNKDQEGEDFECSASVLKYAENLPKPGELLTEFGFDVASMWMLYRPLVRSAMQAAKFEGDGEVFEKLNEFSMTEEFQDFYKGSLPESTWSFISTDLFEFFYSNTLYDLHCPKDAYSSEISRVKKEIERIQSRQKAGTQSVLHTSAASQKNEVKELERLKSVAKKLEADLSKQENHVVSVIKEMEEKKNAFFKSEGAPCDLAKTLLMNCTFPRSIQSPDDAIYCAHFVFQLHNMETPGFSTLQYIDELISVVSGALFGVTEGEAANLAILLWETWKVVNRWRYEEEAFNAELLGKPGSYMYTSGDQTMDGDGNGSEAVAYKEFSVLYNTWHKSIGAALIGCLKSSEYMHTRAGLVVLTRIVEVFPTQPKFGNKLLDVLAPFQDESSARPDIRASANAYNTMLLKARDEGKWVEEDAAVAKARAEKEKAAAEERKRKIAEQFQEMKRDSEKITEEIGPRDLSRDRRREPRDYGSSRGISDPERTKDEISFSRGESGEISGRERREQHDRRGGGFSRPSSPSRRRSSPQRDLDRGRERDRVDDKQHNRNDSIGSPAGRQSDRRHNLDSRRRDGGAGDSNRGNREEGPGGRWKRGEAIPADTRGRGSGKRGRSPDPMNEGRGERTKRTRIDDTRRDSRASSPPRSRARRSRQTRR